MVEARYGYEDAPPIDILVIPGGFGTRPHLDDPATLSWIRRVADGAHRVTSVCTGALLLARAGLLGGRRATTHWAALERLAEIDESIDTFRDERVVKDEVVTSAGVAAGIDMALEIVEDLHGRVVADETARYIELPRQ